MLNSVGITALALRAFLESPENYNESDGAFITRQVDYIVSKVQPDGSISATLQVRIHGAGGLREASGEHAARRQGEDVSSLDHRLCSWVRSVGRGEVGRRGRRDASTAIASTAHADA